MPPFLSRESLVAELARRPGLIPVNLDPATRRLRWLDVESYHFYHGFFAQNIAEFTALKQGRTVAFESDWAALDDLLDPADGVPAAGFIHHWGRCGSTLLARALAHSRRHLVLGEAAPTNQIWPLLDLDSLAALTARDVQRYRQLLLALSRHRLATHTRTIVKFTSFNVLGHALIRRAFVDVPALFVYRDPAEILISLLENPPAWSPASLPRLLRPTQPAPSAPLEAIEDVLACFAAAALDAGAHGLRYLDYRRLTPENLPAILAYFGLAPASEELRSMQAQFAFSAKRRGARQPFQDDTVRKHALATPEIRALVSRRLSGLHAQLAASPLNLRLRA